MYFPVEELDTKLEYMGKHDIVVDNVWKDQTGNAGPWRDVLKKGTPDLESERLQKQ